MFSHFFPKEGLGIEITTKYIRFVHLVQKGEFFHLKNFGKVSISEEVFSGGVLQDVEGMKKLFKTIVQKTTTQQVRITIPGESQNFFVMALPNTSEDSLVDDIVFHLKEIGSREELCLKKILKN
jgi:Tfp pilus assembly PilM family ATPase